VHEVFFRGLARADVREGFAGRSGRLDHHGGAKPRLHRRLVCVFDNPGCEQVGERRAFCAFCAFCAVDACVGCNVHCGCDGVTYDERATRPFQRFGPCPVDGGATADAAP
jgi:hypothetical protein